MSVEDGVSAEVHLGWPDGGPVNNGGLVRMIVAWRNGDNWAEAGWGWRDGRESEAKYWAVWNDADNYHEVLEGDAGARDSWPFYRLSNDEGSHWRWLHNGNQYHARVFSNLTEVLPWGNDEVDNKCDSAHAEFRELKDKACNNCDFDPWLNTENFQIGTENPCFHVDLLSNTRFEVVHGEGAGQTCQ